MNFYNFLSCSASNRKVSMNINGAYSQYPAYSTQSSARMSSEAGQVKQTNTEVPDVLEKAVTEQRNVEKLIERFRLSLALENSDSSASRGRSIDDLIGSIITANARNEIVTGAESDIILVNAENTIDAGDGDNAIQANAGNTIRTGNGNDTIDANADNTIDAGDGDNIIRVNANNVITTGSGNDAINANADNTIDAGDGDNVIRVNADNVVTTGGGNDAINANTENVIDAGNGDNVINVNASNTVTSGSGNDIINVNSGNTIHAGAGDDVITGNSGNVIHAGRGNDTIRVNTDTVVYFEKGDGADTIASAGGLEIRIGNGYSAEDLTISYDSGSPVLSFTGSEDSITLSGIYSGKPATVTFSDGTSRDISPQTPLRLDGIKQYEAAGAAARQAPAAAETVA
ncbi:Ca2+-binding RTX toxin-like protein [Labrenzia sp. MBR-25]